MNAVSRTMPSIDPVAWPRRSGWSASKRAAARCEPSHDCSEGDV
jgi:hypothetical protein